MSDSTVKVTLAYPMTINGRDYQPDDVVELPHKDNRDGGPTAFQLVKDGRGRYTEPESTTKTAKRSRAAASANTSQEG